MPIDRAADLYLRLLAKSLTGTLRDEEPDHDNANVGSFVVQFTRHYMMGEAVTMLPLCRLDNIRDCIAEALADGVAGDVVEAGVWRGGGSIFMRGCLEALGGGERRSFVADSFEGLPEPDPDNAKETAFYRGDLMQQGYRKMAAGYEEVRDNFEAYDLLSDRVCFLKGWFSETLASAPIASLALMRLDGDYYSSTMDGLTALYPKLSPGGFAIIDDYGEDAWTDCRKAVDEYRSAHGVTAPMTAVDSKCVYWRKPG